MNRRIHGLALLAFLFCPLILSAAGRTEHVVLIVWDGMRPDFISREHTPALYELARSGVRFDNHHAVYCSSTEVNGTALATGDYPQHSGIIANTDYFPAIEPLRPVGIEQPAVIRRGDSRTGGHYLLRPTLAEILQAAGKSTVIAGSKNVVLLHDRRERPDDAAAGVVLFQGATVPPGRAAGLSNALGRFPPAPSGSSHVPNEWRDRWTTRALIDPLWSNGVPAFSLLWLSEPDFSQHPDGPGSPRALAALESSDRQLAAVLADLDRRGLRDRTAVFVVSDHGFSTVEKLVDLPKQLRAAGFRAARGFSAAPKNGDVLVVTQGGSALFYVAGHDREIVARLATYLQQQDFSGVVFTRESLEGTFTLAQANIAAPQEPDVVLSLRWSPSKSKSGARGMLISDGGNAGGGAHGSLSRFDLHNTLVAAGPDLRKRFKDKLPSGNVDVAPTILWLLGVKPPERMDGRVLSEALTMEAPAVGKPVTQTLQATRRLDASTWSQYLEISRVNDTVYLDEGNGEMRKR